MNYIVYQNPETNNIEVLIPCVTDTEQLIKDIPKDNYGNIVNYKFIETLPKLVHTYNLIDNEVIQDRTKLHNLKKNEWRTLRKPKLEKLDIDFMKSIEENNIMKQEEIKLKKTQLRNVTDIDISNLSNIELEEYIPDILLN